VSTRRRKSVIGCLTELGCLLALGLGALIAADPALAADPLGYEVELASTGNGEMDSTLKASSQLQTLRTAAPLSPIGLIARARGDIGRLTTVLESFGYYRSAVTITINGLMLDDPTLGDALIALPQDSRARCKVSFQPGPLYHVGRIDIDGQVPELARSAMKLSTGAPAVAADVLAAGARLLTALQDQGYAFARVDPPIAYEDPERKLLNLSFHAVAGERMKVGDISIQGLERMHEKTVRRRLLVHTGDEYSAAQVERARKDLLAMGVFSSVTAQLGHAPDAQGRVPLTFVVREQQRRAVALNAAYSSDLGGSGGFSWTARNLFGYADALTLSASILNLGGTASTGLGYDTSIKYRWQDFGHRDQTLQLALGAIKQSLQAYDQTAQTAGITLNRKLSSIFSASISIVTTYETIAQETLTSAQKVSTDYDLLAIPLTVLYDTTGLSSPLLDPTRGMRASLSVAPTFSLRQPSAVFQITQGSIASYLDLQPLLGGDPGRSVLATRLLLGVAQGASTFSLPPDQRFYVGGSGTVRGYRYQSIGPEFPSGNPIGGTAFNAVNVELRQRIGKSLGFVVFADGGGVSESVDPFSGSFRIGVGAGARYYTPIGALRFDVAVPAGRKAGDDAFVVYIGLGQAF
jgi:translocation and assembly module TamA